MASVKIGAAALRSQLVLGKNARVAMVEIKPSANPADKKQTDMLSYLERLTAMVQKLESDNLTTTPDGRRREKTIAEIVKIFLWDAKELFDRGVIDKDLGKLRPLPSFLFAAIWPASRVVLLKSRHTFVDHRKPTMAISTHTLRRRRQGGNVFQLGAGQRLDNAQPVYSPKRRVDAAQTTRSH